MKQQSTRLLISGITALLCSCGCRGTFPFWSGSPKGSSTMPGMYVAEHGSYATDTLWLAQDGAYAQAVTIREGGVRAHVTGRWTFRAEPAGPIAFTPGPLMLSTPNDRLAASWRERRPTQEFDPEVWWGRLQIPNTRDIYWTKVYPSELHPPAPDR